MDFDNSGILWVGTANSGLYSFNPTTEKATQHQADGMGGLSSNKILAVLADNNNNIWIGTDGSGICQFNSEKQAFVKVFSSGYSIGNIIHTLYQDINNNLWIGTNEGLLVSEKPQIVNGKIHVQDIPLGNEALSVNAIFQAEENNIWAGTGGGGLFKVLVDKGFKELDIDHFQYNSLLPSSLSDDIVLCLFEDRMGLMWIGTNSGLNKFDPKKQSFRNITSVEGSTYNLSDNTVWSIYEDEDYLWVGTHQGLDQINIETGESKAYPNISKSIYYRNNSSVLSVNKTSTGHLLIGTVDGLYKVEMDEQAGKVKNMVPINYNDYYFKKQETNNVYIIQEADDGKIWIGTKKGLAILNPDFTPAGFYTRIENDISSLPNNTVRFILQDSEGQIWVGTEGGVSMAIEESGSVRFETYSHTKNLGSISKDVVMSGWESADGTLWFGTYWFRY